MDTELSLPRKILVTLVVIGCILLTGGILFNYYPIGVDWEYTFSRLRLIDPYSVEHFINPPFTMLFLPHSFLPIRLGNTINIILNISVILFAVRKLGGDWKSVGLIFTSPVFFDLCRTNNIEWLPLLGLTIGPNPGSVFLLCKPQSLGFALIIWAKRNWKILLLPTGVVLLSFVVWGFWPLDVTFSPINKSFNFSVLPIGLPFGVYLLWQAWKNDDEYLAAVSTPFFVPYIAPYSFVGVLTVLTCKYPKAAYWFYFGIWAFAIIEFRRIF